MGELKYAEEQTGAPVNEVEVSPAALLRRSNSQRKMFESCPRKWQHHYAEGWYNRGKKSTLAFGLVIHQIIPELVMEELTVEKAVKLFDCYWQAVKPLDFIEYGPRSSWDLLHVRGQKLVEVLARELPAKLGHSAGQIFEERILHRPAPETVPALQELCIVDYYGPVLDPRDTKWKWGVVDWKTSDRDYNPREVQASAQLIDYTLAEASLNRKVDVVGLGVLVWGADPHIQWVIQDPPTSQVQDELVQAMVDMETAVSAQRFPRRLGSCLTYGVCEDWHLCHGGEPVAQLRNFKDEQPNPTTLELEQELEA